MEVANNCVVSIDYALMNDKGEVLDSSPDGEPLTYLHGAAGIIPGLERELAGKAPGENFSVTITPDQGFGEHRPEMVQQISRSSFPEPDKLQPGMHFNAQSADGQQSIQVRVTEVGDDMVTIDANHPLAGMTLTFEGSVQDVREATDEEKNEGRPL